MAKSPRPFGLGAPWGRKLRRGREAVCAVQFEAAADEADYVEGRTRSGVVFGQVQLDVVEPGIGSALDAKTRSTPAAWTEAVTRDEPGSAPCRAALAAAGQHSDRLLLRQHREAALHACTTQPRHQPRQPNIWEGQVHPDHHEAAVVVLQPGGVHHTTARAGQT